MKNLLPIINAEIGIYRTGIEPSTFCLHVLYIARGRQRNERLTATARPQNIDQWYKMHYCNSSTRVVPTYRVIHNSTHWWADGLWLCDEERSLPLSLKRGLKPPEHVTEYLLHTDIQESTEKYLGSMKFLPRYRTPIWQKSEARNVVLIPPHDKKTSKNINLFPRI